jgi:hypothetical protein
LSANHLADSNAAARARGSLEVDADNEAIAVDGRLAVVVRTPGVDSPSAPAAVRFGWTGVEAAAEDVGEFTGAAGVAVNGTLAATLAFVGEVGGLGF